MISKSLDLYLLKHDNIIIVEDFNMEIGENNLNTFGDRYRLSCLIT